MTEPVQLCLPGGTTLNPLARGWSRVPMHDCNLAGTPGRKKRWDYWAVLGPTHTLSVTYADIDFLGITDVWWADLRSGRTGGRNRSVPGAAGISLPDRPGTAPLRSAARHQVLDLTDEDWHKGMEVYFLNVVRPTRLVTPIMAAQKSGVIVNISTFAAFEPDPVFPTSGVFRAGLAAFTKLFADRYAGDNIRMNNVLPGFIDSLPEKEEFRSRIPMGRYGHEDEIAATVAFLASDAASYVTGLIMPVDGGLTCRTGWPNIADYMPS